MIKTYGAIEREAEGWTITEIAPHVAIRLKQIFPQIAKHQKPPIKLTSAPGLEADLDWFMSRYPLRVSEGDQAALRQRRELFERELAEVEAILSPDWRPGPAVGFREGERPYPYQQQAAELARRTGRLLLMDDLGLGKTVSAIAAIARPEALPALVVPQTHLCDQWKEKVTEFTRLRTHIVKTTKPYALPEADVYICPYSRLAGWADHAETAGFRSVVFDEIQDLRKGRGTAKGAAAFRFARAAAMRIGLSATPIFNYGSEIFAVMQFIEEGCLGSFAEFDREWCGDWRSGGAVVKDPAALGSHLADQALTLRRTKAEVGRELRGVNVVREVLPFEPDPIEREEERMAQLARTIFGGSFTERGQASREFDMRMRLATGLAKAPAAADYVSMLVDSGRPVVLCGWHRDVYEIWMERLARHRPALYTGSESPAQKKRAAEAFVAGESDVLILSLRSGAGLDGLQARSSTIVFGELDWSPKVHEQCVGRLHRPGQTQMVDAVYLTADGGADPTILSVLGLKASQSHGITDPLRKPDEQVSDRDRIKALARRWLEERGAAEALAA